MDEVIQNRSGWVELEVIDKQYTSRKCHPFKKYGSAYIPLPDVLKKQKCLINIQNKNDQYCFLWFHACHVFKKEGKKNKNHPTQLTEYKNIARNLKYEGITCPLSYEQISKI